MALSAIEIYEYLEQSNCGECGCPTCLAFAMQVAQKQSDIEECPRITDEAIEALGAAAAPPMATVTIGDGDRELTIGGETVLFRHDETFHNMPGIAIRVSADTADDELKEAVQEIEDIEYDRVGQIHKLDMVALEDAGDADEFADAAELVAETTELPIILITEEPDAASAAAGKLEGESPLLYAANDDNFDEMVQVADDNDCVLTIQADGDLDRLVEMSENAQDAGVEDLVLDTGAHSMAEYLEHQAAIRRACLEEDMRAVGYPTIFEPWAETENMRVMEATTAICKYAGIIVCDSTHPSTLLPLITARLNIYTDPQKPIQIPSGLYEIGEPDEDSPVLTTTNFSLTYYTVESEVSASGVDCWVVVVDTEGKSVLTAWANDDYTPESIAETMTEVEVEDAVNHHDIVIPGGVAVLQGKLEEESGWEVVVGPREATGVRTFLKKLTSKAAAAS